jgi:DNA-binding CsgD family transcriptional regulator
LATRLRTTLPLALDQLTNNRVFWLRFVNIEQAREVARSGYERSLHEGGASGMWSGTLSWLSVDAGDLDAALGLMRRGNAEFERFDPFHNVLMLRALAALVHAVRGEIDLARAWLDRAGPIENMEPRSRVWTERASAWVIAGTDGEGAYRAIAAGERAEQQTIITWGAALLYHDAVRLGGAGLAADHLSRISSMTTAPLVELMSRHACAAAAEDAQALTGIAEEFVARGSPLLGAEALAQASMFSRATGADRARALMRASNLAERCPGAATPLMRKIASPLSEREQDVARAVARGATSRDVAGLLSLSVRTVDNHLASIYRKLELSGRDEIISFFG